ncbi:MAG: hypothetical protein HND58_01940 [Planctomycetota bacterium]|nr:MAG: hypothetical protein HND58_01940 [Planctomycetota bacterium]
MGQVLDNRAAEDVPTIIAGDFNAPWRAMPLDALRQRGYREAHRVAGTGPGASWPGAGFALAAAGHPDRSRGVLAGARVRRGVGGRGHKLRPPPDLRAVRS